MVGNKGSILKTLIERWSFTPLLIGELLILLVGPFARATWARLSMTLLLCLILLLSQFALSRSRHLGRISIFLMGPALLTNILKELHDNDTLKVLALSLYLLFLIFTIICMLSLVLRRERVTTDKLAGAMAIYLLLGITAGIAFRLLDTIDPGCLKLAEDGADYYPYFYFSFVTLTTLGFGDITPVSRVAQSTTVFLALCGQMYLAILVARLVGLHIVYEQEELLNSAGEEGEEGR